MTCLQCALANGVGVQCYRPPAHDGNLWILWIVVELLGSARHLAERSRDGHAVMRQTDGRRLINLDS
jgi:hypothetical protein